MKCVSPKFRNFLSFSTQNFDRNVLAADRIASAPIADQESSIEIPTNSDTEKEIFEIIVHCR